MAPLPFTFKETEISAVLWDFTLASGRLTLSVFFAITNLETYISHVWHYR